MNVKSLVLVLLAGMFLTGCNDPYLKVTFGANSCTHNNHHGGHAIYYARVDNLTENNISIEPKVLIGGERVVDWGGVDLNIDYESSMYTMLSHTRLKCDEANKLSKKSVSYKIKDCPFEGLNTKECAEKILVVFEDLSQKEVVGIDNNSLSIWKNYPLVK